MAYGTLSNKYVSTSTSVVSKYLPTGDTYTHVTPANTLKLEDIVRYGTNLPKRTVINSKKKEPIGYRTVVYYVREPNHDGRAIRFISKKTGKPYWIRPKFFKVRKEKRKPIYSKSKRPIKGLRDLPPNLLSFSSVRVTYNNLESVSNGRFAVSGRLTNQFRLSPSGPFYGFHPQNDVGSARSNLANNLISELDASCYTDFLSRIKDSKINLAQAFAERRQTAMLIVDLAIKATSALKALKHGNLAGVSQALFPKGSWLDNASDYWLAYHYGVRPLLLDIKGAMDVLAGDRGLSFDVIRSKTKQIPFQKHSQMQASSGLITSDLYCKWDTFIEGKVTVKYKASVVVTSPGLQKLASLGLINLQNLAWELVPYSFVIDWVLPVGDYLESMDALTGVSVPRAHRTIYSHEKITCVKSFNGSAGGYTSSGSCTRVTDRVLVSREPLSSLPPPPLPKFNTDRLDFRKLITSLALLNQLK